MTADDVLTALALPPEALVGQRVPKTLLAQNGAPTAADKRQVQTGIETLRWSAALKPTTVGVPAFRDADREILEVAVLRLDLRPDAKAARLATLVHRAIPYPVVLVTEQGQAVSVSLAHKRASKAEAGRTVLDGDVTEARLDTLDDATARAFLNALDLARLPRTDLFALYEGLRRAVEAVQAAEAGGTFALPSSDAQAADRRDALRETKRLDAEIAALETAARRETQMARRVDLNLQLARLRQAAQAARARL